MDAIAAELADIRHAWRAAQSHHAEYGAEGFPSRGDLSKILQALCGALFPLRLGPEFVRLHNENAYVLQTLETALARLYGQIRLELIYAMADSSAQEIDARAAEIIGSFARALPQLRKLSVDPGLSKAQQDSAHVLMFEFDRATASRWIR